MTVLATAVRLKKFAGKNNNFDDRSAEGYRLGGNL